MNNDKASKKNKNEGNFGKFLSEAKLNFIPYYNLFDKVFYIDVDVDIPSSDPYKSTKTITVGVFLDDFITYYGRDSTKKEGEYNWNGNTVPNHLIEHFYLEDDRLFLTLLSECIDKDGAIAFINNTYLNSPKFSSEGKNKKDWYVSTLRLISEDTSYLDFFLKYELEKYIIHTLEIIKLVTESPTEKGKNLYYIADQSCSGYYEPMYKYDSKHIVHILFAKFNQRMTNTFILLSLLRLDLIPTIKEQKEKKINLNDITSHIVKKYTFFSSYQLTKPISSLYERIRELYGAVHYSKVPSFKKAYKTISNISNDDLMEVEQYATFVNWNDAIDITLGGKFRIDKNSSDDTDYFDTDL